MHRYLIWRFIEPIGSRAQIGGLPPHIAQAGVKLRQTEGVAVHITPFYEHVLFILKPHILHIQKLQSLGSVLNIVQVVMGRKH